MGLLGRLFFVVLLVLVFSGASVVADAVVVVGDGRPVELWSVGLSSRVYSLGYYPGVGLVYVGLSSGRVAVFSTDGVEVYSVGVDDSGIRSLSVNSVRGLLAAGSLSGSVRVYSIDSSGALSRYWSDTSLSGEVRGLAWSPDGDLLAAVGDFNRVVVYSWNGRVEWRSRYFESPLLAAAWSPDGGMLAVGTESGRLVVYSRDGSVVYGPLDVGGIVLSLAWSPNGAMLAVGTRDSVIVYGTVGWKVEWQLAGLVSPVRGLSWSPDGKVLAAVLSWYSASPTGKVMLLGEDGSVILESGFISATLEEAVWAAGGDILVVGGGKRLIAYDTHYSIIKVSGPGGTLEVALPGGDHASLEVDSSGLLLLLDPGEYVLSYTANNTLGPALTLSLTAQPRSYEMIRLPPPGSLVVEGRPGSSVVIGWPGGSATLEIPAEGAITVDLMPGNYTVSVGLEADVGPAFYAFNVTVWPGSEVELQPPEPGMLVIEGVPGTSIILSWDGGEAHATIPEEGVLVFSAAPADYTLTYTLPANISYPATMELTVYEGLEKSVRLPGPAYLTIITAADATVRIVSQGSSLVYQFEQPGSINISAHPGLLDLSYTIAVDVGNFTGRLQVQLAEGEAEIVQLPAPSEIIIEAPSGSTAMIQWDGGVETFTVDGSLALTAAPGEYIVTVEIPADIGDTRRQWSINTLPGHKYTVAAPGVYKITISGPPGASILLEWDGSRKALTIPGNGVVEITAVEGSYTLTGDYRSLMWQATLSTSLMVAGEDVSVRVEKELTGIGLGIITSIIVGVPTASALIYHSIIKPTIVLRRIEGYVLGGNELYLELELENRGLLGWKGPVSVVVDGTTIYSGVLRLEGRGRRVLRLTNTRNNPR